MFFFIKRRSIAIPKKIANIIPIVTIGIIHKSVSDGEGCSKSEGECGVQKALVTVPMVKANTNRIVLYRVFVFFIFEIKIQIVNYVYDCILD